MSNEKTGHFRCAYAQDTGEIQRQVLQRDVPTAAADCYLSNIDNKQQDLRVASTQYWSVTNGQTDGDVRRPTYYALQHVVAYFS